MSDVKPSPASSSVAQSPSTNKARKGFFSRKPKADHELDEKTSTDNGLTVVEQQKPPNVIGLVELFRFATKTELLLDTIGLVAAVAAGATQPLMTLLFGNLTNAFVEFGRAGQSSGFNTSDPRLIEAANHFRRISAKDASGITYIGVAMFVTTFTYMYLWVYTGEVMTKRIREKYLHAILRQDIAFFDNVGAGEVATRIQTDTHLIQQGTSEKVAISVMFTGAFFTGFILAFIRSWRLALACSSMLPVIAITGGVMNAFVSKYVQLSRSSIAEGGTIAEEVISTIRTAQAFGTQKKLASLYDVYALRALVVDLKAAVWQGCGVGVFFFVMYAAYGLTFSFGTTLILDGHADAGAVINVFLAILIGSFSLALLAPEVQAVATARGAAAKIFETIDRVPTIDSASPDGLKPDAVEGVIELEHVKFNYPSRPGVPIIKDLSIKFEAGKTAALVGASGSGKSTVVSLIERFYDPLEGVVKLDGTDLRTLNVKWLRTQIGLVSQEPTLFATTIAGNVAHGLIGTQWENESDEEKMRLIKDACIKANADGFISKLPNGYETMVGERGFLLSGGQKQRVAIARAIVSDPRILLLDEATSALDTQSEGVVQNALDKASAGRTTVTIAHRLSTIKDADCIFVMGEGVVLEQGTHTELLEREDSAYARLVQAQQLREAQERDAADDDSLEDEKNTAVSTSEIEKKAMEEVPLGRRETGSRSIASEIIARRQAESAEDDKEYGLLYLFMRIGKLNREVWWMYGFGSVFASMTGMIYPAFGIVFAEAIQSFQLQEGHAMRVAGDRNALWCFLIAIVATLSFSAQNNLFGAAASRLSSKLRSLSIRAIFRQDIQFFDQERNSTGILTSRLSDDPQKVNGLAGVTLGAIVQSGVCLIGASVLGLAYGWKLALVGIACIPLVVSAGYIRLRVVVLKDQVNKAAHEESAQLACEAAAAIRTVASLTREGECCDLYSETLLQTMRESNRAALFSNLLYSLSQAMSFFVISLVFWYGSRLVSSTEYSTKQFFICLISTTFASIQGGNVFMFVPDMSSARGAANNMIHLLDSVPEIDADSTEGKTPQNIQGRIRFENVHFRYPTRPAVRVLRSLNLEVERGTYVALVGASGSGKSTVIQLIERFYDPLAGKIYLDDELISDFNVQEYRKQLALVSQEPTLYAGTIRFNILLGAIKPVEKVTQEEVEAACRDANILSFIQSLPDGFETEVGGKGSQLSGGQKQRIAIARALLRNPKVLLLDEATSALDSNSEKVVQEALDQAAKGRTTIAIAHRLSTIQNADCIYFIKDGVVSESGTHDQLLAQRGGYYEYVQLQGLGHK